MTPMKAQSDATKLRHANRWWVSWWEKSEDYRPMHFPPNLNVLGWWCSGERRGGGKTREASICAVVEADSEKMAKAAINRDWPGDKKWRFCTEKTPDYQPSDRFPLQEWMRVRFEGKQ